MKKYELLYILPAKFTDAELVELRKKISGIVTGTGAVISEEHDLGKRKLAYPINHVRNGNYVLVYFEAEPTVLAKLSTVLRLSTDLLRHLLIERDLKVTAIPVFTEEEPRRESRHEEATRQHIMAAPMPVAKPNDRITMEEVEKKLDEILTEEVK